MFVISKNQEKRVMLALSALFFVLFLYALSTPQKIVFKVFITMLLGLTIYAYARLQKTYKTPKKRLILFICTVIWVLFIYIVVLTQQPALLRNIMTIVAILALIFLVFDQKRKVE
ncbi:MAG: hypothetical protein FJ150_00120 [Euryarchaeota archaeon]|nr:hypothetical protein [Euryarchaeota archaeon]